MLSISTAPELLFSGERTLENAKLSKRMVLQECATLSDNFSKKIWVLKWTCSEMGTRES